MGQQQSSEAGGIDGCAGCGVRLPPANKDFDFIQAMKNTSAETFCFWTPTQNEVVITDSVNVGLNVFDHRSANVGAGKSVSVTKGTKLFKYFRIKGSSEYWCSKCFAINKRKIAQSVFYELMGDGKIVSPDMAMVKIIGDD
ncbi:hypothetical protein DPMN_032829 [Dreissena polymorpha]|uniref:Uncharacterized protein n=1 Tax=Dreissena polymorpha TaxID=45954 RepID=A0A9D4M4P0_DREPO|nr:hypothetical protein DPMN_032829 [Dreissena polymorpha]